MAKLLKKKKNKVSTKGTKKTPDKDTDTKKTPAKLVGVKRREKKKNKKPPIEKIDLDNVDEDELLDGGDEVIPSEDEGGSDDDRKHQKLLEAISALGGKKKRRLAERSEATVHISEFSVDAKGEGDKINLSDLIQTVAKTPAVSAQTKSHLKKLKLQEKTVDSPLTKPETERIQRDIAFQKTTEDVSRWQSIVKKNQKAEQLVFPLTQEFTGPKPLDQVVCGWKARTPLEQEIFSLLSANKQPIHDPIRTPMEEQSLKAMSLEDARIRRAELQKARAMQSYYEAKARRERNIKSKKYHKAQNKAKGKEFVKKFDEMLKSDPVSALEELKKLELGRMKERMSLKHQNSGKWAKSKAIMAKYDDGARKAMQQQLEVNKDLTQKPATTLSDEEEEEEEEAGETSEPDMLPDCVNEVEPGRDPANPWMRGQLSKDPVDATEPNAPETAAVVLISEDEEEGPEETEEERLLRGFAERRKQRQEQEAEHEAATHPDMEENMAGGETAAVSHADADIADDDEEEEEEEDDNADAELSKFTNLFQELKDSRMEAEASAMAAEVSEPESAQLQQAMFRIKSLEDMDLLEPEEQADPAEPTTEEPQPAPQESKGADKMRKRKRGIDLAEVLTKEATVIQVPLAPTAVEGAEGAARGEEEQRDVIKEAFAGDDVISDFLKDKRREEEAARPKVVDLTLPGWGEWGGQGLQPSKKKRKKFRQKTAPRAPRKDGRLPTVIISEKRDSAISMHQVARLPRPFQKPQQFEATMRTPVGATWNTRQTVKKITMPKIVTRVGAIIEPMSRGDLLKHSKQVEEATATGGQNKRKPPQRKRPQKRHKKTKN